jgi:ParB family chromosome partitioning protein
MAVKKRGLGRGLDALLGAAQSNEKTHDASMGKAKAAESLMVTPSTVPLDKILRGPYQPRRDFDPDTLQELADSIIAQGILQPIVVRPK